MNIRAATAADIPAMRAIEAQAASAAHWSEAAYRQMFAAAPLRLALVVEENGQVEGFAVAKAVGSEWELENIVISSAAQGRGFGRAMLLQLLEQVRERGGHSITLEVRASNTAARALYEKCSFLESGRRRGYYVDPPEDAICYRLSWPG
jgi:ribosomal-protein-alanine acetyltransferase